MTERPPIRRMNREKCRIPASGRLGSVSGGLGPTDASSGRVERGHNRSGATSAFRGVTFYSGAFHAFVFADSKRIHAGSWANERDAAIARDRAALFFGLDTPLNDRRKALALGPASPKDLCRAARA